MIGKCVVGYKIVTKGEPLIFIQGLNKCLYLQCESVIESFLTGSFKTLIHSGIEQVAVFMIESLNHLPNRFIQHQ